MKFFAVVLIFYSSLAFSQAPPGLLRAIEELSTPIGLIAVSHGSDEEVAKFIEKSAKERKNSDPRECSDNDNIKDIKKDDGPYLLSSTKLGPSIEFYFEVTAPVEEVRTTDLDQVALGNVLEDLAPCRSS